MGQQVKDLVRGACRRRVCPPRSSSPEARRLPRGLARGRDHYQVRPHRCTCRSSTRLQAGSSFKTFRIDYMAESPYGNDTPVSPGGRHRPVLSRHALPRRTKPAPTCRPRSRSPSRQRHPGRTPRPLRHPLAGPVQPARAPNVRLTDTLSWNSSAGSLLSAAGVSSSCRRFPRTRRSSLARQPLRDGPRLVARASLRMTAEAYRKTYTDYPVASDLPPCRWPTSATPSPCATSCFRSRAPARGTRRRGTVRREATHLEAHGQGNLSFSRTRHAGPRPRAPARLVRLPIRVQPARRLSTLAGVGTLGPAFVSVGPAVHAVRPGRCPRHSGAACTTSRASTPSVRLITAASTSAWTAP